MKKLFVLGLITAVIMMFSAGVLAEDPITGEDFETDAGWYENYTEAQDILETTQVKTETGEGHVTVEGATVRSSNVPPYDADDYIGDQEINVTINTSALIPCYLELELIGNAGYTKAKSIGANAVADVDRTVEQHWMLFNPEFGGLMDSDWNLLGDGEVEEFSTLGLTQDLYINACDMWTANMYANVDYGFDVTASPLTNGEDEFNMDMRVTAVDVIDINDSNSGDEYTELETATFGTYHALDETSLFMQFRVPFNDDVPAGQYDGDITFSMYSI